MLRHFRGHSQRGRTKPSPPPSYDPYPEDVQVDGTGPETQITPRHVSAPARRASETVIDDDRLHGRDTLGPPPFVEASLATQPPPLALPPPHLPHIPPHEPYPPPHEPYHPHPQPSSPPHHPYSPPHHPYSPPHHPNSPPHHPHRPSVQPYAPSLQPNSTHSHTQSHSSRRLSESTSSAWDSEIHSPVSEHEERGGTVRYTFKPIGPNAMVLLPPSSVGREPRYYISVSLNCFMPFSHITTVYRGADETAPRVCEFEMGILGVENSSTLRMEGSLPHLIQGLFNKDKHNRDSGRWIYKLPNNLAFVLTWDISRAPFTCSAVSSHNSQPVARFTSHIQPIPADYRQSPPSASVLEIFPAGRKCFDDILVSLLILERKRLTPAIKYPLFNY